MTADRPLASLVVITRNRRDELAVALESCFAQDYRPLEVLVFDDASTDGTDTLVRERFPDARYFREDHNRGIAAMRARGFREARGEFVFSIDDDAYYTGARTVADVVEQFHAHPEAAVMALPFIEPRRGGTAPAGPPETGTRLRAFISCAYAIRRQAALDAGSYREFFFYRGEERDLSIRLLDRGHAILFCRTAPVVHLYSPKRAWDRMFPLGIRNNLLFDWLNIPHPCVLPRMALDAAQLAVYKVTLLRFPARLVHIARGFGACVKYGRLRRPVSRTTYRLYRDLPNHSPVAPPGDIPAPARPVRNRADAHPGGLRPRESRRTP